MAGSGHHPFIDYSRQIGGESAAACRDCDWTQAVDEDLHEGHEDLLLSWHATHPEQGFDHLSGWRPGTRLKIPGYIRWSDNGFGGLAIFDERTAGAYPSYNHGCLAIFRSVAENGDLSAAEMMEARRLGISPRQARGDIRAIAASLYQSGLLQSASADSGPSPA